MVLGVGCCADQVLERGEKIELLVDKSEMLSKDAVRFKKQVHRQPFHVYNTHPLHSRARERERDEPWLAALV